MEALIIIIGNNVVHNQLDQRDCNDINGHDDPSAGF